MKPRNVLAVIVLSLLLIVAIIPRPMAGSQFVISGWSYPDEYGQGISFINVYENSTGSWVLFPHDTYGNSITYDESPAIDNWTTGVSMKLRVGVTLNATVTGASSVADGQNYLRLNVTVLNRTSTVFSQENFTYQSGNDLGLYYYDYDCVLNFIPQTGLIYRVLISYEIFFWEI